MAIKLETIATLRHINIRKEGPNEDKVSAIDLKFTGDVPADIIDKLICPDDVEGLLPSQAFWDSEGAPRFLGLSDVGFHREIHNCTVTLDTLALRGCTLKRFSFLAKEGLVAHMTFSASTTEFPSNAIAILAEFLQDVMRLTAEANQGELFDQEDNPAAALDESVRNMGATGATLSVGGQEVATFGTGPDPLLKDAIAFVRDEGRASITGVQRKFKIGYNRAARLVEAMEAEGVVSAMQSNGQRKVFG